MSASYKKLLTILLFLCIFLNLPLKSNESSNNLRKNSNFLRQLEGEGDDASFFSLSLIVINKTVTCDDNTTVLPLFNPNSELNFSETNLSLKVDGAVESFKPISCSLKNGNVIGLNITEYTSNCTGKCQEGQNISVTINFEQNTSDFSSLFENTSLIKEVKFGNLTKSFEVNSFNRMFTNCSSLETVDFGNNTFEGVYNFSYLFDGCKNLVNVTFSNDVYITDAICLDGMFNGCERLSGVDLSHFTFEKVEKISNLFNGCKNLLNVSFSENIKSENLTDIDGMFEGCELIEKPKIENFNFSKVKRMNRLFKGCKNLNHVEFNPKVPIEKVEDFSFAFDGCEKLQKVNLSTFTFEKVEYMSNLFNGSKALTEVFFGKNITSTNLTSIDGMFEGCEVLKSVDLTVFNFSKVEKMNRLFKGCKVLVNIDFNLNAKIEKVDDLSFAFDGCDKLEKIDLSAFTFEKVENMSNLFNGLKNLNNVTFGENITSTNLISIDGMFEGCEVLKSVDLTVFNFSKVEKMDRIFKGCKELNKIEFNPNFPIQKVEDLSLAFDGCERLEKVDLTPFTFEKVGNMSNLFSGLKNLNNVTFGDKINSANLTSIDGMFEGCEKLNSINLTVFDFSKVTKMDRFFKGCRGLNKIDFNPNKEIKFVKDLSFAFDGCENLIEVNLTAFTFDRAENMSNLFNGSKSLVNITFGQNINSENLIDINGMFEGCENILDPKIQYFNFKKVKKMNRLFKGCKELRHVEFNPNVNIELVEDLSFVFDGCENLNEANLTTFRFDHVENMSSLFNNCKSLSKPIFPESVNASLVSSIEYMFAGCENLVEFNLSKFTFSKLESASHVFHGAKSLKTVELHGLDFSTCKSISFMFTNCASLTEIDLSGVKTSELLMDFSSVFSGCSSLESVDLSGFNFSTNCNIDGMFSGCTKVTNINLSGCTVSGYIDYTKMFAGLNMKSLNVTIEGSTISEGFLEYLKENGATTTGTPKEVTKDPYKNSSSSSKEKVPEKKSSGGLSGGATAGIVVATVAVVVVVVVATVVTVTTSTTVATAGGAAIATGVGATMASSQAGFVSGATASAAAL